VGRRLAGEPLHDVLEAGGVGADELRLDELDLHVVVLPAVAIDRHGHATRSVLSGTLKPLAAVKLCLCLLPTHTTFLCADGSGCGKATSSRGNI
jgi:hypothetical protein